MTVMLLLWALFAPRNFNVFAVSLIQEGEVSDSNDLGKLLLGGFVLAVAVAIALTFVRIRLREKKPPAAEFISISSFQKKE